MIKTKRSGLCRYLEITIASGFCAAVLNAAPAVAAPIDMTVDRLLTICESQTVQAAQGKGEELGWQRLTDAEIEEWRTHFFGQNIATMEIVGWRREKNGRPESLSFWATKGQNQYRTCLYSTKKSVGLLDGLSERLGTPDKLDRNDATDNTTAWWIRDPLEYSLVQVGAAAIVTISPKR